MNALSKHSARTAATLCLLLVNAFAYGNTRRVCRTCPYTSVKQAVALAMPGDTVVVDGGVYTEGNLILDKPISLIGKNNPVLDGQHKGEIITIKANHVLVQGFTLRNVEVSYLKDYAAINVVESDHVQVRDNRIEDAFFGIYLQRADSCVVSGNMVTGKGGRETSTGNAIHLWYCNMMLIENNTVSGHRDGIYLEFTKESSIRGNLSQGNIRYGMHFMFSDGNVYTGNTFRKNGAGVAVMYTRNIHMEDNTFEDNWGAAAYGLLLKDISRSTIRNNTFKRNTTGIYLEGSSKLDVAQNDFLSNGWAVRLLANCSEDTFRLNNFVANSFDVATNGNTMLNYFTGNHWDKYHGYDLDKDKTGDVPYRPVSLYSMLVERVPSSVLFMRSFIVNLMDKIEKVIPSVIPEQLVDARPSMKKIRHDSDT